MTLRDKVVEQGEVESQSTIQGICEIDDHENKIIFLAPEGSFVRKGQVVCKFDSSKFDGHVSDRETRVNDQLTEVESAEQDLRVQKDENESAIRAAEQAVTFAKLDLDKYIKGDYEVKKSDLQGAISEGETSVEKAKRGLENMRTLVKRGFREYEQLREAEQVLKSAELRWTRDKQKFETLENFEHVKSLAEFKGKHEEAGHKLETAKTTAEAKLARAGDRLKNEKEGLRIQQRRLKELKLNLERHTMKAPQDGTFVYATDDWRGNGEKLHEGKMVYQNQPIFVLPDMTRMQVKVGVHESLVGKTKPGQPALIRVDAFSTITLRGKVEKVALLSDSTRWEPSNNYSVIVKINEFPETMKLKPGMNAEVEILVGNNEDVLAVPIQALASFGRNKFVFVKNAQGKFESREVSIGKSNISFIAIDEGLSENEVVALDAYQRALSEFGDEEPEEKDESEQLVSELKEVQNLEIGKTSNEGAGETADDLPPVPNLLEEEDGLSKETKSEAEPGEQTETSEGKASTSAAAEQPLLDTSPAPGSESQDSGSQ